MALALLALLQFVLTARSTAEPSPRAPGDVSAAGRPASRTFTSRDGLPQNSLMSMAFDRRGYLWVGTQDGAATYNGRAWTVTNLPNREASNMIRCVFVDSSGAIWFGRQDGGAARLLDGEWRTFDAASGAPFPRVNAIHETAGRDALRALWFASDNSGLFRFDGTSFTRVTLPGSGAGSVSIASLVASPGSRDRFYAATSAGVFLVDHDGRAELVLGVAEIGTPATCVLPLGAELWVGTGDGRLLRVVGGRAEVLRSYLGATVYCLMATPRRDGGRDVWVGTDGEGVEHFDGTSWVRYDSQNLLPSESIWSFAATGPAEEPSTIWIGTDGGLVRIEPGLWRSYDQRSGLPSNSAYSLLVTIDDDGGQSLWAGLRGTGMVRLRNGQVTVFDSDDGLTSNSVFALHESRDAAGRRTLWVGTQGGGLGTFANGRFTPVPVASKYPTATVRRFLEVRERDGTTTLWVATGSGGVLRLRDGTWSVIDRDSGLPVNGVYSLEHSSAEDGLEALWVGTQGGGVASLVDGEWRVLGRDAGLDNLSILGLHVARFRDGRRILFAGTEGAGVALLDLRNPSAGWTTLSETTAPAIPNNTVYQVLSDTRDRVYLFTNQGVARLSPQGTGLAEWDVFRFTTEDGLPSNEFNGGASHRDALGRIWGGTVAGVTMFDPSHEPNAWPTTPLYIERRYLTDGGEPFAPGAELRYDQNGLTFEFALLSYFRESDTRYQTQLVGLEGHPSEWSPRHTKDYTTLPAGSYVFRVWARDALGNVAGPAEVAFTILPAPWLTWWAFALYGIGIFGVAFAAVSWRERTLRRRNEDLEAKIAERTAELAEKSAALAEKVRELELSEREASAAREEALEANRAKSVFLSNMSHELRTPLNAVLGFAQLMARDRQRSSDDQESLSAIARSGEHLLQLINDVLSISKIEAGRLTLNEEVFDLQRLFVSVEEMTRARAQAKGLRLEFELEDAPRAVRGDQGKVRQVLVNLLSNAVKFTDSGCVALRARFEPGEGARGVCRFEASDTGAGIAPEELDSVFEAFVQTETGRQSKEGTGLGMAITKSFVELMGGEISVTSEVGAGTTFRFHVPLAEAEPGELQGEQAHVVGLEPGSAAARILVVDDKWENRTVLARLLTSIGLEVREAANGREAVDLWREWRPDAIFMDMRMPVMDGVAATRAIREAERGSVRPSVLTATESAESSPGALRPAPAPQPPAPDPPTSAPTVVIALSASAFEHERDEILGAGCDDFVAKPFREATIFDRLSAHLGLRFVRSDREGTAIKAGGGLGESALTVERLAGLRAEWLDELQSALVAGNVKAVNAAVDQIGLEDGQLAEELREKVKGYEFDEVLELLERIER